MNNFPGRRLDRIYGEVRGFVLDGQRLRNEVAGPSSIADRLAPDPVD